MYERKGIKTDLFAIEKWIASLQEYIHDYNLDNPLISCFKPLEIDPMETLQKL